SRSRGHVDDKLITLILDKLFLAIWGVAALYIGAYLTRRSAELAEARKAESEEKASARRIEREEVQAKARERRSVLTERLACQHRAFDEYARVIAKWSLPEANNTITEGIAARVRRTSEDDASVHRDAISIYVQLAQAFGSHEFAEQAMMTVHAAR